MNPKPKKLFLFTLHPSLFTLLVLPFLLGAKGNTANDRGVCIEGFLKIVSPDQVSVDQCWQVAKMALAAWNFDLKQMNWDPSIDMQRPLKLRLLSHERMKAEHPNSYAFAASRGKVFVTSTAVLHDRPAVGTFAHELGHVQAFRALGGKPGLKVPHYFLEGHGISLGRAYGDMLGSVNRKNNVQRAKAVKNLTAREARLILTTNTDYYMINGKMDGPKNYLMEAFGYYFFEWLRVRKGMPLSKSGRVFELVGQGLTYPQAFKQVYGISINQAISEVTAFMEKTQSNPAQRLKGTHFEGN